MLIKCEKCEKFIFPEVDEDGNVGAGCKSPSVIQIDLSFMRLYKCKYSKKIKYETLLKEVKRESNRLASDSFFYRDPGYQNKTRRKMSKWKIKQVWWKLEHYFELRDYLFNEVKRRNCSYACFQDSYRDYKANCSICIDNKDLDELKRAKRSYIPKFMTDKNTEKERDN